MGVRPALGAGFPADVLYSRERLVVISHRLWTSRSRPTRRCRPRSEVQRRRLHGGRRDAGGFTFPGETDIWQRLTWDMTLHSRGAHFMEAVARMKPDVRVADAQRELDALTGRLAGTFAGTNGGWRARAIPLHDEVVGLRPVVALPAARRRRIAAADCVHQHREPADGTGSVARARGGGAGGDRRDAAAARPPVSDREPRCWPTAGGVLGVALAFGAMKAIVRRHSCRRAAARRGVDGRPGAGVCTRSGAGHRDSLRAAAGAPGVARRSAAEPEGRWTRAGAAGTASTHRVLVAAEVALAVMLLAGAGLLVRSVAALSKEDPGFRPAASSRLAFSSPAAPTDGGRKSSSSTRRSCSRSQQQPGVDGRRREQLSAAGSGVAHAVPGSWADGSAAG